MNIFFQKSFLISRCLKWSDLFCATEYVLNNIVRHAANIWALRTCSGVLLGLNCNSLTSALYGLLTIVSRKDIDLGKKLLDSLEDAVFEDLGASRLRK